jgi:hypothetical protein
MKTKIVQFHAVSGGMSGIILYGLGEDGVVYRYSHHNKQWEKETENRFSFEE